MRRSSGWSWSYESIEMRVIPKMAESITSGSLMYAVYFAPRGKRRLLNLGHQLGQRHLNPLDKLIGVIGDAGAGKSLLINGMFPGLELTNDDSGINIRPLPLLDQSANGAFTHHTYHVDIRFEMAFTPAYQLAEAIRQAVASGRRVIVEHFELIYPLLAMNAEILIGLGEEVLVTRPNIFGPLPDDIAAIVFKSVRYRRMAHSAEDLTELVLRRDFGFTGPLSHDDVKHGFVLEFTAKPELDLVRVEERVMSYIEQDIPIQYHDDSHVALGSELVPCTGPRLHVRNTGAIQNFQLIKEFKYDPIAKLYLLVGLVGSDHPLNLNDLNDLTV